MTRQGLIFAVLATFVFSGAAAADEKLAREVIDASGVGGGLCVHVGVTDGALTAELSAGGRFVVHGLSDDAAAVTKAREVIRAGGLYGKVSVSRGALTHLPYADDMVNLLVVDDLPSLVAKGLPASEVLRVLVPGGVAMVGTPDAAKFNEPVARAWLAAAGVVNPEIVARAGKWARAVKPRPAGLDEWTHWRHDVDGNTVSRDTVVDVPRRVKWMVDPTWARSHVTQSGPRAMVSSGGRLFYVYDDAPRGLAGPMRLKLTARDAFNGFTLWERPIESAGDFDFLKTANRYLSYYWYQRRSLVAVGSRVYTVLKQNGPLVALDAATGDVLKTYDKVGSPNEVLASGDRLYLAIHPPEAGNWGPRIVCALDAGTGAVLWKHDKDWSRYLILAEGGVFYDAAKEIVRVRADTGEEQWRAAKPEGARVLCFTQGGRLFLKGEGKDLYAVSAADGKHLWTYNYRDFNGLSYTDTDVYFVGGLVWVQVGGERWAMAGIDPATGAETRRIDFPENYPKTRGHHRCHPNKATSRYFLLDTRGIDFIDRDTGKVVDLLTIRGSCYYGVLPANGLLYVPPNACQCGEYLRGFIAFAPLKTTPAPVEAPDARFERGPAWGQVTAPGKAADDDWPTYRHDPQRSGVTPASVPTDLAPLWQTDLGGRITAPVIAGGMVLVARPDVHEVCALDARTGEARWRYTADGRVDSPPTVHAGTAVFGTHNGWVTCLRATDGAVVWRFRAAPCERQVSAFGQLESAWPVNGSVLVQDGKAFFAAGRFSELDDGIHVYAADAATGKTLWETRTQDCLTDILAGKVYEKSFPPVAINDVLAATGDAVSMRNLGFDAKTGEPMPKTYTLWARSGMLDGNSWVGRMQWRGPRLHANLLVFDRKGTYGFTIKASSEWPVIPGKGEYVLFAKKSWEDNLWAHSMALRAAAMIKAGDTLFVAGVPDAVDETDYWAAVQGRKGAELWMISAADGTKTASLKLDAPPVFDGLAAASGRLYLATTDGKLRCLGAK